MFVAMEVERKVNVYKIFEILTYEVVLLELFSSPCRILDIDVPSLS